MSMDEVTPGLWIGDLQSALDVANLKAHKIFSILSAMRGRITINETFIRHQILLDDTEDADILQHLLSSIHFIQAELDKGRGVLVHCHGGISRSATIVAAYLMYSRNLDTAAALEMIRKVRPNIEPNQGFARQLEIFHQARFKISRRDKTTRMFYMERALEEVMNGDGTMPETDMFAKFPNTPSDSIPSTPGGPRRRIRCKMCRYELATREHMLDHGQLGPATPAVGSPAASRRPSALSSHRPSMSQSRPLGTATESRARRSSLLSFGDSLSMSALDTEDIPVGDGEATATPKVPFASTSLTRRLSIPERPTLRGLTSILNNPSDPVGSMSALEDSDDEYAMPSIADTAGRISYFHNPTGMSDETAREMGRRMSDAMISSPAEINPGSEKGADRPDLPHDDLPAGSEHYPPTHLFTPAELAAQLHANPKLAALRSPMAMTPLQPSNTKTASPISPPILINPKCSGYFVEPMKWMEPLLESGQLAGKILCPNTKCGAKLGNFDWAGMRCGCKEWVTPGFCINRSKVDEVV